MFMWSAADDEDDSPSASILSIYLSSGIYLSLLMKMMNKKMMILSCARDLTSPRLLLAPVSVSVRIVLACGVP